MVALERRIRKMELFFVSFISYVLGSFINEFVIHRKTIRWDGKIDKNYFYILPNIAVVTNVPKYLKNFKASIEINFLFFHLRILIGKGKE